MKFTRGVIGTMAFLGCALQIHCTLGPGLSTPEQREKVVALTRLLESDPLVENAPATRQWLRKWIIEVPEIKVYACGDLLGHGLGDNYPYSQEVNLQAMFSAAAFAIEHPEKARDKAAQYHAGVEGALRVYEVLLKARPDAKSEFLDEFLAKRDHGELADHVAKLAKVKCKKINTVLIANLAGAGVGLLLSFLIARWFSGHRAARVASLTGVTAGNGSGRIATILQPVVFVCAAYYVIVGIALHILEPELDPRFKFMSAYALTNSGWLMTTTFFVLGLAAFAVAAGLRQVYESSRSARIGIGLLVVGALFVCLAGVFKDSLPHLLAGVVAFPSISMTVLLLSWTFRQAAGWQTIYRPTLFIGLGMLAMYFSMVADVGMPGLQQRIFLLLFLLWLSIVAHRLMRVTAAGT